MIPAKPFPTYTWRWISVTPSEGLLKAPVFLGVLRVLAAHEGQAFSSEPVHQGLAAIQIELKDVLRSRSRPVTLARDNRRNIMRNSGQYWRGTGLITQERGTIHLTDLGRRVASGAITQAEFAALMVQQTVLPNRATYNAVETVKWEKAALEIRPLQLILQVIDELGRQHGGMTAASMNNDELIKVVIPLAGAKADVATVAEHVARYRRGQLNLSGWPDCAPAANDKRLTYEFLMFLASFGVLRRDDTGSRRDAWRFYLDELFDIDASTVPAGASIFEGDASAQQAVEKVRHSPLPSIIERQRILASVIARPKQSQFRSGVIKASEGRCLITGETISAVLEAAHIVPVKHKGADERHNGICLRVDIHRLFDSGNLRIARDGAVTLSEAAAASPNYQSLPTSVTIPEFVNPANVAWRDSYL